MVPCLRDWVNSYYYGTLTGITEYNWGGENHINGAPGSYLARLTVTDNQGASNQAATTIQVNADLPNAPSNLTASAISRSQINLLWTDNANNETGFKIERRAVATCPTSPKSTSPAPKQRANGALAIDLLNHAGAFAAPIFHRVVPSAS
jgi:hypothetical protein